MDFNEKEFIAGFNNGYLLSKYEPSIMNILLNKITPVTSYVYGLTLGCKEFELEKSKIELSEISKLRKNRDNEIELE